MKVAFINGSPRKSNGITAELLAHLETKLPGCEITHGWEGLSEAPFACEGGARRAGGAIVIAFPLYVDAIPSNLLRELAAHETGLPPGTPVYALVNNGFYEGEQNANAVAMLRHWSKRAGLAWGQGIGVGAGGILNSQQPGRGPLKSLGKALDVLARNILAGESGSDIYTRPDFPRALYKLGAEISFRAAIRKNGLSRRDVERKLS